MLCAHCKLVRATAVCSSGQFIIPVCNGCLDIAQERAKDWSPGVRFYTAPQRIGGKRRVKKL
jgi:hypothetical protein